MDEVFKLAGFNVVSVDWVHAYIQQDQYTIYFHRFRWRPELVGNGQWAVALDHAHQRRALENLLTVP